MAIETRYARNGDVSIAYQAIGHGAFDLVFIPGFISNLELHWEDPGYAALLRRLSRFARLIPMDKRGTGLSDGVDLNHLPDLRKRTDDILAVMEAAGSGRAALLGASEGAAMSVLFAATYPERSRALVLFGGYADFRTWVDRAASLAEFIAGIGTGWGSGATLPAFAPSRASDAQFRQWWARLERLSASPSAATALVRMNATIDVRGLLDRVRVPTLIIHRSGDARVSVEASRYLAKHIAGSTLVEMPGSDHTLWTGDIERITDLVEEFLTGTKPLPQVRRVLAALVSGRLVAPERAAARLGDGAWRDRLERLREAADTIAARHGGTVWSWDGNRLCAHFQGPASAVGAAIGLRDAAAALGVAFAQGVHVGEVDAGAETVNGIAVHMTDRIADRARGGEILASSLVQDLAFGSGLHFDDHSATELNGSGRPLHLVSVATVQHLEPSAKRSGDPDLAALSPREREVLSLVAAGLSNVSIATNLSLSEHTVKRHVANILLKLDLPTRAAAAALSARQPAS